MASETSALIAPRMERLPNGMTVLMERLPYLRSVSAGLWIRTGSANETPEQSGISHFLEHLFFKGTKTRTARQLMEVVENRGGQLNAFTSREYTCLYVMSLTEYLSEALDVLFDITCNSLFCDLEKERNVILEEIASIEDVPEDYSMELLVRRTWPEHPLGMPVSGLQETVSALTLADIRAYYEKWYRPEHIFFSVAGNFDEEAVLAQVAEAMGAMTPGSAAKCMTPPAFHGGARHVGCDISQTHIGLLFPAPPVTSPGRYACDVLSNALGGASTSRLFESIREQAGLAYSIYTFQSYYYTSGVLGVYAAVAPQNCAHALELIFKEIREFRDKPMDAQEVEIHRNQIKGAAVMAMEGPVARATHTAKSVMYGNHLQTLDDLLTNIGRVSEEDLAQLSNEMFRPENCSLLVYGPPDEDSAEPLPNWEIAL